MRLRISMMASALLAGSLMGQTPPRTSAVLILPFQAATPAEVDLGIGVHNLLENMLLQHGGLEETWVLNSYPSLFPKYAELESYRLGRGEAKDLDALPQRWLVTGRVESGKVSLVVLDRLAGKREAGAVALDPPGWIGIRKEFVALLERAGVPWTEERSAAMYWLEDLPAAAM